MAGVSEWIGWIVFNVAIPLLAPFALLPFAKVAVFSRTRSNGIVRRAIEDGQLLWAAIPLNASACYGIANWIDHSIAPHRGAWALLFLHVLLIVAGSMLVLLGAMDAYPRRRHKYAGANLLLRLSIFLSCVSAAGYAFSHFAMMSTGR